MSNGTFHVRAGSSLLFDHHGVALHHGAHRDARFGTILGWHRRDDGHEDAIDPHASELAHMSMHDLRWEAHRVRRDRRQAVFVHFPRAQARELHIEAQRAQKRRPKRRSVPQGQHARQAHGYMAFRAQRTHRPFFKQKALAHRKQVRRRGDPLAYRPCIRHAIRTLATDISPRAHPFPCHKRATVQKTDTTWCANTLIRALVTGHVWPASLNAKPSRASKPNKRAFLSRAAIVRDKRTANSAHKARVRRTHHVLHRHIHLKRAQHGVVGERASPAPQCDRQASRGLKRE